MIDQYIVRLCNVLARQVEEQLPINVELQSRLDDQLKFDIPLYEHEYDHPGGLKITPTAIQCTTPRLQIDDLDGIEKHLHDLCQHFKREVCTAPGELVAFYDRPRINFERRAYEVWFRMWCRAILLPETVQSEVSAAADS